MPLNKTVTINTQHFCWNCTPIHSDHQNYPHIIMRFKPLLWL